MFSGVPKAHSLSLPLHGLGWLLLQPSQPFAGKPLPTQLQRSSTRGSFRPPWFCLPSAIPIVREGFSLLGCPVRPPDFCEASFQTRVDKIKQPSPHPWRLPSTNHSASLMPCTSQSCLSPRLRACPPPGSPLALYCSWFWLFHCSLYRTGRGRRHPSLVVKEGLGCVAPHFMLLLHTLGLISPLSSLGWRTSRPLSSPLDLLIWNSVSHCLLLCSSWLADRYRYSPQTGSPFCCHRWIRAEEPVRISHHH